MWGIGHLPGNRALPIGPRVGPQNGRQRLGVIQIVIRRQVQHAVEHHVVIALVSNQLLFYLTQGFGRILELRERLAFILTQSAHKIIRMRISRFMTRHVFATVIIDQGHHRLVRVHRTAKQALALKRLQVQLVEERPVALG